MIPELTPGTPVRIARRTPAGHVRVPGYAMGARGIVLSGYGPAEDPETLAYGVRGEPRRVYRVRVSMAELWPGDGTGENDALEIEIYDHWLAPLEGPHDAP
ncbi:MAG: nitrile hydratase subunit beta [Rhodobacteraceae bacterium]|nr:nitrile hydratase subunit beta [Paracoccaceae bacterium]